MHDFEARCSDGTKQIRLRGGADHRVRRRSRRRPKQPELRIRTWGGKREGAGRPKTGTAGVRHSRREIIGKTTPVHVTLKVAEPRLQSAHPALNRRD